MEVGCGIAIHIPKKPSPAPNHRKNLIFMGHQKESPNSVVRDNTMQDDKTQHDTDADADADVMQCECECEGEGDM